MHAVHGLNGLVSRFYQTYLCLSNIQDEEVVPSPHHKEVHQLSALRFLSTTDTSYNDSHLTIEDERVNVESTGWCSFHSQTYNTSVFKTVVLQAVNNPSHQEGVHLDFMEFLTRYWRLIPC